MAVLGVVVELGRPCLLEVHEGQQAVLDIQVVEDQRVLDGQVDSEEDFHVSGLQTAGA